RVGVELLAGGNHGVADQPPSSVAADSCIRPERHRPGCTPPFLSCGRGGDRQRAAFLVPPGSAMAPHFSTAARGTARQHCGTAAPQHWTLGDACRPSPMPHWTPLQRDARAATRSFPIPLDRPAASRQDPPMLRHLFLLLALSFATALGAAPSAQAP